MSKFKQVAELGGVQLGDVWSDQGTLIKVIHIDRNTDSPMPILCVHDGDKQGVVYHNECHMVADCKLVERDGQEVEQWVNERVSNVFYNTDDMYGSDYLREIVHIEGKYAMCRSVSDVDDTVTWCAFYIGDPCGELRYLKP